MIENKSNISGIPTTLNTFSGVPGEQTSSQNKTTSSWNFNSANVQIIKCTSNKIVDVQNKF